MDQRSPISEYQNPDSRENFRQVKEEGKCVMNQVIKKQPVDLNEQTAEKICEHCPKEQEFFGIEARNELHLQKKG